MPDHSYTSRRELEEYRFSAVVTVGVPLVLLGVQRYLPKIFPQTLILDLPLLAVIFFAVARRNPIAGALTGTVIGLVQDAATGLPIGINGMAKAVIGYVGSSIGVQVDVESLLTRVVIIFGSLLAQSGMLGLIHHVLLGEPGFHVLWLHELLRAVVNTVVAIPLFWFLDRFKQRA